MGSALVNCPGVQGAHPRELPSPSCCLHLTVQVTPMSRLELHPSSLSQPHHLPSPSHQVHKPQLHISAHPAPSQLSNVSCSCFFPSLADPSACSTRQSPGQWQWEGAALPSELPGICGSPRVQPLTVPRMEGGGSCRPSTGFGPTSTHGRTRWVEPAHHFSRALC